MNRKQIKQEIKIKTNQLLTNLNKMSMKKVYLILAAAVGMTITSCTTNDYLGDVNNDQAINDGSIQFGLKMQNMTRADIYGKAAADLLDNHFYVTGTKGTEASKNPTEELVFDNYLVHYGVNTAGTTASNTANWEYVGVKPGTGDYANYAFLTSMDPARLVDNQTIKYWDYSKTQYDFMAFSTGTFKAVSSTTPAADEIGVTAMKYGTQLDVTSTVPTAYTFYLPSENALKNTYISDIVEVPQANYGKEVQLQFKNLGSKVRVALYETIPGYSVKNVQFYTVEGAATPTDLDTDLESSTSAILISPTGAGIPTKGTINVLFPHVGTSNDSEQDYNKATATVSPGADPAMYKTFGALTDQLVGKENKEAASTVYLGRSLTEATFAGDKNADFYQTVFPISTSSPLILRVNYTLVPTDGASETIVVKGAKAVVPSTYTKWLPNYAYTYIFKISDNTNGWTGPANKPAGLFPITFDAVVTEATDFNAEQRTITTVATPSITTYQQYHKTDVDEYSITVKDLEGNNADRNIYVQVMDNTISPAKLIGTSPSTLPLLNTDTEEGVSASRLFDVTAAAGATISEATVMDALENRTTDLDADDVEGRNNITLTKVDEIVNTVTSIVNGVDDNPIEKVNGDAITAGQVAEIDISDLTAGHTYAYVYDYTGASTEKNLTTVWQPIATVTETTPVNGLQKITVADLTTWDATAANHTSGSEAAVADYLYFSVTTNGGANKVFSFVSVDDKIGVTLPKGLLKLPKGQLTSIPASPAATAEDDTFYFTTYVHNDGKYAVKVIKIVS